MRRLLFSAAVLSLAAAPALAQPAPPPHGPWGGPWAPREQGMWMRMMQRQAGDSFRFKHGSDEIDIRCSPEQPIQSCVEAATRIMQGISSMKPGATGPAGSASGTSTNSSTGNDNTSGK